MNSDNIYCFLNTENTFDAINYLKNPQNFRPFNQGIKELLYRHGYDSDNSIKAMTDYLYFKLYSIGSSTTKSTVESWLNGTHRPKIEAGYRKQVYEICFSLNLSLDDTVWFFNHVYYDRAFNCHTIDESVYYYAFKNGISYKESLNIIKQISEIKSEHVSIILQPNYTQFIQNHLNEISSIEELISFLSLNKESFNSWNISAYKTLSSLFQSLIPSTAGKKDIDNLIRTIKRKNTTHGLINNPIANHEWHIIMQEFFSLYTTDSKDVSDILMNLKNVNICSNNFVLNWILYQRTKADSDDVKTESRNLKSLPYIVRNNFPSKKTMSDVLCEEKVSYSKSYDSIRKMIILLYFYRFWCDIYLHGSNIEEISLSDIFIDEVNDLLYQCGYENLFAGNPYDWLFLTSAQADSPLVYFRSCISDLILE